MTGKRYNWHKAWRWQDQRLVHDSGIQFIATRCDGYTDINAAPDTLEAFQAFEMARGVPLHDLAARLQRITKEAAKFYEHSKNDK